MNDFAAYVFYVNRPDLLRRAIDSFSELRSKLVVVNNSGKEICETLTSDDCVECCFKVGDLFNPPVPLSYTQSMNWMVKDATEKKVDFILHFHSDAVSTNPHAVNQLLDYARQMKAEGRKWACLRTFYDIFWAINPLAVCDIGGWDTIFPAYFSDNDQRRRWNLAGWETIDTHIEGITHEGSATINSDPELKFLNSITFPLYEYYYAQKWAGSPGKEKFTRPFNR